MTDKHASTGVGAAIGAEATFPRKRDTSKKMDDVLKSMLNSPMDASFVTDKAKRLQKKKNKSAPAALTEQNRKLINGEKTF